MAAPLDALQELPEIGGDGPVGFYGLNTSTVIGVPLTAIEPRIVGAVRFFARHLNRTVASPA